MIPKTAEEHDIREVFKPYGEIEEVGIDFDTNAAKVLALLVGLYIATSNNWTEQRMCISEIQASRISNGCHRACSWTNNDGSMYRMVLLRHTV